MKTSIRCTDCTSYNCSIKRFCTEEQLDIFADSKNMNFYHKGDSVFREGNTMQGIHFIHTGAVEVVTPDLNGREQVVRLAAEGSLLGHRVLGNDKYYFNAIALSDSNICFASSELFKQICLANPEFSYNLILMYALELRKAELRVKYHAQMNIREKVAQAFVYINEVFGINSISKSFNIELSRREIADIAGTTAEQVTRQLTDFEEEKLIQRDKREIKIINLKGIEDIVKDYRIQ